MNIWQVTRNQHVYLIFTWGPNMLDNPELWMFCHDQFPPFLQWNIHATLSPSSGCRKSERGCQIAAAKLSTSILEGLPKCICIKGQASKHGVQHRSVNRAHDGSLPFDVVAGHGQLLPVTVIMQRKVQNTSTIISVSVRSGFLLWSHRI